MRKRILSIILAVVMVMLCACSGSKESAEDRARRESREKRLAEESEEREREKEKEKKEEKEENTKEQSSKSDDRDRSETQAADSTKSGSQAGNYDISSVMSPFAQGRAWVTYKAVPSNTTMLAMIDTEGNSPYGIENATLISMDRGISCVSVTNPENAMVAYVFVDGNGKETFSMLNTSEETYRILLQYADKFLIEKKTVNFSENKTVLYVMDNTGKMISDILPVNSSNFSVLEVRGNEGNSKISDSGMCYVNTYIQKDGRNSNVFGCLNMNTGEWKVLVEGYYYSNLYENSAGVFACIKDGRSWESNYRYVPINAIEGADAQQISNGYWDEASSYAEGAFAGDGSMFRNDGVLWVKDHVLSLYHIDGEQVYESEDLGAQIVQVYKEGGKDIVAVCLRGSDNKYYITTLDEKGRKLYDPVLLENGSYPDWTNVIGKDGFFAWNSAGMIVLTPDGTQVDVSTDDLSVLGKNVVLGTSYGASGRYQNNSVIAEGFMRLRNRGNSAGKDGFMSLDGKKVITSVSVLK